MIHLPQVAVGRKLVIPFWGGECGLTVELQDRQDASVSIYDCRTYGVDAMEYAVILPKRPRSNTLRFDLDSWGLDFFHQPRIAIPRHHRPEHIVNSYAIYHKTKGGFVDAAGPDYKTGKACHLYRSWSEDARGRRVWNRMWYRDCELTIRIPQEFLDAASYPLTVDPTFGYTTQGASNFEWGANTLSGAVYTLGVSGTLSSMSVYCADSVPSKSVQMACYNNASPWAKQDTTNSGTPVTGGGGSGGGLLTVAVNTGASLSAADYVLMMNGNNDPYYWYDSATATTVSFVSQTFGTWAATYTQSTFANFKMSVYATYTASGGGVQVPAFLLHESGRYN